MPNVTPNPFNNPLVGVGCGAPPSPGKPYAAMDAAHAEAMCGRVIGKLERFNDSLDSVEKLNEDFRVLIEELDRKLGNAPPSLPTANAVACGGAGEKSPASVPSLESSVGRLQSQEERISRNLSRLRSLINSL